MADRKSASAIESAHALAFKKALRLAPRFLTKDQKHAWADGFLKSAAKERRARQAAGWRPIDDEAKRGQLVLIYHPHWEQTVSFWADDEHGWIYIPRSSPHQPTHWMPLPPAPTEVHQMGATAKE